MTVTCPNCGEPAQRKTWHDGLGWLIEVDLECTECGYHYNLSYGKETIEEGAEQ